jgi:hypothetical protein
MAIQILLDPTGGRHAAFWKEWAESEGVRLISLYGAFGATDPNVIIDKYFIPQDIHWNTMGQRYAAEAFLNLYDPN